MKIVSLCQNKITKIKLAIRYWTYFDNQIEALLAKLLTTECLFMAVTHLSSSNLRVDVGAFCTMKVPIGKLPGSVERCLSHISTRFSH